jgi:hypothetical protein
MLIAVANRSTLVSNDQVNTMCQAIQIQLDLHVAPAWHSQSPTIRFYANEAQIPGYAWVIYMIDNNSSVPNALGYHEETNDKIDGYIMCQPILSNGGAVMNFDPKNPGQYTVSGTLSHEAIELAFDRYTNCFFDFGNTSFCGELCDPVEQIGYEVVVNGVGISCSDFIFPSWVNPYATSPQNEPFNYLRTIHKPFTMLPGGYTIQRTGGPGTETQVFGKAMPAWRKVQKKSAFSRMNRRKQAKLSWWKRLWVKLFVDDK